MQALKTAIQQYYIEQGRFPSSLSDLPIVQYQEIDPDLYVYDPVTGSVKLRTLVPHQLGKKQSAVCYQLSI